MPLEAPLENLLRLTLAQRRALLRLGMKTAGDLFYHFPHRYIEPGAIKKVSELQPGEEAVIYGRVKGPKTGKAYRRKTPMGEAWLADETGKIKIVWFHQAFLAKTLPEGTAVRVTGKVRESRYGLSLTNPEVERVPASALESRARTLFRGGQATKEHLIPVYSETRNLSSRWFFHAIEKLIAQNILDDIKDPIPHEILKKYHLPDLKTALLWIHRPARESHAQAARKRFSFQEIFYIQLARQSAKHIYRAGRAYAVRADDDEVARFLMHFSFDLTRAQKRALAQILSDIKTERPMMRLLEGDVGSGKTAVAATAVSAVAATRPPGQDFGNLQTAYMAPTEILARQHFESFISYFKGTPIQIGLITGSECRKFPSKVDPAGHTHISRAQLLRWVSNGEIPVVVGTHALIQEKVAFKHLAFAIIDEQHRFGVMQRAKLGKKGAASEGARVPHLLSMTATPIPRTLALTMYGDLDLSLIDEMPKGRKRVLTKVVPPEGRRRVYEKIREELKAGRQAYVVCPRIDEPDPEKELAVLAKSAKKEAERLQKEVFPEYRVGLVHSKLKAKEKEDVMNDFLAHKIDVLTATSVVEVGVNVPNATAIVIEGAERFGLAQLHQLRGRVLRSAHQACCFLFTDSKTQKITERLKALEEARNGFELAERDLSIRGEGSLAGTKQWGVSDIGMEGLKNIKMVEAAREEARKLTDDTRAHARYPELMKRAEKQSASLHFE